MSNRATLKPFGKGDSRINRKGRPKNPKNLAELRDVIQAFLAEPSTKNKTRLETLLANMARSKGERKALLEFAFGKVPVKLEGPGDEGEFIVKTIEITKTYTEEPQEDSE